MPSNAKYLALYMASYMNMNRDVAWPSQKTIERETGLAHATILKWLDFLVEEGWLAKQSGSRTESNRYWISFPNEVGHSLTYVNQQEKVGQPLTSNNNTITNTTTTKKKSFIKPTIEEVKKHSQLKGFIVDTDYFFDFYTTAEWKDAGGKPVKNWKLKLLTWNNREKKNDKRANGASKIREIKTGGIIEKHIN